MQNHPLNSSQAVSRRQFIKSSSLAAASAAVVNFPAVLHAQNKQAINAIIIGLGGRGSGAGQNFIEAAKSLNVNAKIVAVADTFDAMLSDRPYRTRHSLGEAASQISKLAPDKLDAEIVLTLLVQLRREAVDFMAPPRPWATQSDRPKNPFIGADMACNLSPMDIDHLASELNRRVNRGRSYLS